MKYAHVSILLFVVLAFAVSPGAASSIQAWPEGWSTIDQVTATGIYGNRFVVHGNEHGTVMLTVDGLHLDGLALVLRGLDGHEVVWETVVAANRRVNYPYLVQDESDALHLLWQEQVDGRFRILYSPIGPEGELGGEQVLLESQSLIQEPVAVFVDDQLHILWVDARLGGYDIFHGSVEDGTLQGVQAVSSPGGTAVRPAIAAYDGTLQAAWIESGTVETTVFHSELDLEWSTPSPVGPASTRDGETVSFLHTGSSLELVWTSVIEGGQSSVMSVTYRESSGLSEPRRLAWGSRARVHAGAPPVVVWQRASADGHQVYVGRWHEQQLDRVQRLSVHPTSALRPEVLVDHEGHVHVYWLEAHQELRHRIVTINTKEPRPVSPLRSMGIDDEAPVFHIGFVLLGATMMSLTYLAMNAAVLVLAFVFLTLLAKIETYRSLPISYLTALVGVLILLLMETPLAFGQPQFAGSVHWALSGLLAWLGTSVFLLVMKVRTDFETMIMPLLWLFWFQVFALVPQALGMV